MASRKKPVENPEIENLTTEGAKELNETVEQEAPKSDEEASENTEVAAEKIADVQEEAKAETVIPDAVRKILVLYPGYEKLYVDAKGGVFPADTQPNLVANAILYQNPYYKH